MIISFYRGLYSEVVQLAIGTEQIVAHYAPILSTYPPAFLAAISNRADMSF
jgi:hypothetical protein